MNGHVYLRIFIQNTSFKQIAGLGSERRFFPNHVVRQTLRDLKSSVSRRADASRRTAVVAGGEERPATTANAGGAREERRRRPAGSADVTAPPLLLLLDFSLLAQAVTRAAR